MYRDDPTIFAWELMNEPHTADSFESQPSWPFQFGDNGVMIGRGQLAGRLVSSGVTAKRQIGIGISGVGLGTGGGDEDGTWFVSGLAAGVWRAAGEHSVGSVSLGWCRNVR